MLAPRNVTGDNEASPRALATVLKKAATDKSIAGAGSMLAPNDHLGVKGRHHVKEGVSIPTRSSACNPAGARRQEARPWSTS